MIEYIKIFTQISFVMDSILVFKLIYLNYFRNLLNEFRLFLSRKCGAGLSEKYRYAFVQTPQCPVLSPHSILNSQFSTLNSQLSTLNSQLSTSPIE